jgi:hypothetical protein
MFTLKYAGRSRLTYTSSVHNQVNTASYNEKTLVWNIFPLQVITKTAVKYHYVSIWTWIREARWAHFYDTASKCLVLMVLWTWCESFEVLAGVNITVLECDIVWFGRHALKFWKNLLPHVQCRCFSQKYEYVCTKLHIITSQKTVIFIVFVCVCVCVRARACLPACKSCSYLDVTAYTGHTSEVFTVV